jgi:hypothetical protein
MFTQSEGADAWRASGSMRLLRCAGDGPRVFGRAPGTAGLVCLIRADSLAESNWTVSLADCDDFRLRRRADDYNDFAANGGGCHQIGFAFSPASPARRFGAPGSDRIC